MSKKANTSTPIHDIIAKRWSPYAFSNKPIKSDDITALFEAARWAPSSFNEQPWRYLIATQDDQHEFDRLLNCLVEANQAWARHAYLLALGITASTFSRNQKPNRCAQHDLGLASANLCAEATARNLFVHQMAGFSADLARSTYKIPKHYEICTALAIGYLADTNTVDEQYRAKDQQTRQRRPLKQTVFTHAWENPSNIVI